MHVSVAEPRCGVPIPVGLTGVGVHDADDPDAIDVGQLTDEVVRGVGDVVDVPLHRAADPLTMAKWTYNSFSPRSPTTSPSDAYSVSPSSTATSSSSPWRGFGEERVVAAAQAPRTTSQTAEGAEESTRNPPASSSSRMGR